MLLGKYLPWLLTAITVTVAADDDDDDEYNILRKDGSFDFGYKNPDNYHYAQGNRNNVVRGEFGGRNPKTGAIDSTHYTAGPRGYRPRGKNVVRKYDLSQAGPRPVGSPTDPYYDPYEDPSYSFSFRTRTYNRDENANRVGDVNGRYSYIDDVGERHNVEFTAGKQTGFHVKTPFPDSNPRAYGPLYFRGRGRPIPRGRTSIQRGLDGSYKFVSSGPDQRRTETSDATGHVRGSYTYIDDKGVQHSVHYIAGPETGYRVLKNVKGPHLPEVFPFQYPDLLPDYYDNPEIFNTAATGHRVKPNDKTDDTAKINNNNNADYDTDDDFNDLFDGANKSGNKKPFKTPVSKEDTNNNINSDTNKKDNGLYIPPSIKPPASYSDEDDDFFDAKKPDLSKEFNKNDDTTFKNPTITIGSHNKNCQKCQGAVLTNVGDTYLSVPPGVSVRAHVQAIDLLPYSSRFPGPSDQYKADVSLKTEQLNADKDEIVDEDDGATEETTTEIVPTTFSPKNVTIK